MSLLAYIQGKRKGKTAHDIERQAMQDPFLADALDGFDSVEGNHVERIAGMRGRVSIQTRRSNRRVAYLSIAASLLLCIGVGGYFLMNTSEQSLIAQSEMSAEKEELPEMTTLEIEEERVANEIAEVSDEQVLQDAIDRGEEVTPPPPPIVLEERVVVVEDAAELVSSEDDLVAVADAKDESGNAVSDTEKRIVFERHTSAGARQGTMTSAATTVGKPTPKIGMRAYKKYLKDSMVRPKTGDCARKKGDVILEFKINADGRPYHIEYRKKLCEELDKEAVRLVENGSVWVGDTTKSVILEVTF